LTADRELMMKLARLRQAFGTQLPSRLADIRHLWLALCSSSDDVSVLREFHRKVHSLTGAAGTFGADAVSVAARNLELEIAPWLDDSAATLSDAGLKRLQTQFQLLNECVKHWVPEQGIDESDPEVHPLSSPTWNNFLIIVDSDETQRRITASILQDYGYSILEFANATEINAEHIPFPPGAIIVHTAMRGEDEGVLLEVRKHFSQDIPLVLISELNDARLRLAAVRAGALRYFAKPVAYNNLALTLDGLTKRVLTSPFRVLIVDDDLAIAEYFAAILREYDIDVRTCDRPLDVLAIMDEFRPELVLLDVYMPECSGLELAAMIRQDDAWAQMPIVFISSEADLGRQLAAMDLGGDDFLTKPVNKEHLVAAVFARLKRTRWVSRLSQDLRDSLKLSEYQRIALDQHAIVSITDIDGVITHVNEKFCQVSGYARDELIGKGHGIINSGVHTQAFFAELWQEISSGQVWHGEICNRKKTGEIYWVDSTIVPFLDDQGRPYQYVAVRTDITGIKQVHEELSLAKTNAERASQIKTRFLSSMSHELRTPLNAILGFSQVLGMDPSEPLSEAQEDSVQEIEKAGKHLLELINDILDLAKIEDGRVELNMQATPINDLIEMCVSMVSPLTMRSHLQIFQDIKTAENETIWADEMRLKQGIINLLSNACKYNRLGGSVTIRTERRCDDVIRISVIDTGKGIPEEKLSSLFTPFNRLGAESSDIEGSGIGLVITRNLIEMMGGAIGCSSEVGVGSEFWLELSSTTVSIDGNGGECVTVDDDVTAAADHVTTLLYIEDNPANVRLVNRVISKLGRVNLFTAHDAELGLRMARTHRPDVILLDINLAGADGVDILEKIKGDAKLASTPVIAMGANGMLANLLSVREAGFADHVTKPIEVDALLRAVRDVLPKF
jgi:PAS domain S-box-containing protein